MFGVSFALALVINIFLFTNVNKALPIVDPTQDGYWFYYQQHNNSRCEPFVTVNCNGLWKWKY